MLSIQAVAVTAALVLQSSALVATDTKSGDFGAREAEHLLNRAGFGGNASEVESFAKLGRSAAIAGLFEPRRIVDPYFVEFGENYGAMRDRLDEEMSEETASDDAELRKQRSDAIRALRAEYRRNDARQMASYTGWWVDRMVAADDPLRDRMTLFWAGLFTSAQREVRSSAAMIEQHLILRDNALGSYADILRAITRDPAMLQFLDNASNKKASPNENFARELLELFTLGEGNYSEADIVAAARAFTGWTDRRGEFSFRRSQHDRGEKTFMGVTGNLDGDDIIDILLAQEQCAQYVATRIVTYFEGRAPSERRAKEYGALLRSSEYQVRPLLERLFADPAFYAADVVGQRIASPIDLLVGHARRLAVEPPSRLLVVGASSLGEALFDPPSVKGWDGDRAWISTTTFMQRGNLAGVLVGTLGSQEFLDSALAQEAAASQAEMEMSDDEMMDGDRPSTPRPRQRARRDDVVRMVGQLEEFGWRPSINLSARVARKGAATDAEVVEALASDLLGVPIAADTRADLIAFVADERAARNLPEGAWGSNDADLEALARRLAHLVLALPEAQLH